MRFDVRLTSGAEVAMKLLRIPTSVDQVIERKMQDLGEYLASYVREQKLSGGVLQERSGALKASIVFSVAAQPGRAVLTLGSDGSVPYADIQERGGVTSPHTIEAVNYDFLHFFWNGREVWFNSVNHPGSNIKAAEYLRGTVRENDGYIRTAIANAINEGLENANA